jgi:hypothetical protein
MKCLIYSVAVSLGITLAVPMFAQTESKTPNVTLTADYPQDRPGIMLQNVDWVTIASAMPSKTKAKHGLAASLSYGAVPATVVAEYEGLHAQLQIQAAQPMICICHILSLPGDPVLVKLHSKKNSRELDGGKMTVLPIVGGSKMADANQSDLVPVDVSQPENMVWLVRPRQPLEPGEYALMLGTKNVNIYPFTFAVTSADSSAQPTKH